MMCLGRDGRKAHSGNHKCVRMTNVELFLITFCFVFNAALTLHIYCDVKRFSTLRFIITPALMSEVPL